MSTGTKVAKNASYLLMAFVGQKLMSFVYFILVARLVGLQGSGRYFLATAFTTIFSILVDLGLSNVLTREIAKRPSDAQKLLNAILGLKVGLSVLAAGGAMVAARLLGYPAEILTMIGVAAIVMVLDGIHLSMYAALRGVEDLRFEAMGVVTGQMVTFASGLGFAYAGQPLVFLIVALVCGSLWNVGWAYAMVRRRLGFWARPVFDLEIGRMLWAMAAPFALAGIFSRVYSYLDSVMLSKLAPESAVGVYGVAYKVAFAFQFLPMAFAAAAYPSMSATFHSGDRTKLAAIYSSSLMYLLMVVAPLAAGVGYLSEPLLMLVYGSTFTAAAAPLSILMCSLVFAFLYWPSGSMLNACDRQAKNTWVMGTTMLINMMANALLIPKFGAVGAAVAALIGNAVLSGGAWWQTRSLVVVDWRAWVWRALRVVLAAVAMGLMAKSLVGVMPLVVIILLAAVVYAGLLFASGAMTWLEVKQIAQTFFARKATVPVIDEQVEV